MTRRALFLLVATAGLAAPAAAQFTFTPAATVASSGDRLGQAVVPIGDLDGNGVGDYAVGAPFAARGTEAEAGAVRIVRMASASTVLSQTTIQPTTLLTGDNFGMALAVLSPAPALRLLVGTPGFYGYGDAVPATGRVYVLTINAAGTVTATDTIDDTDGLALAEGDRFGASLAVLSTGTPARLAVGVPGANCTATVFDCGAVSLLTYTGTTATQTARLGLAGAPNVTQAVPGLAAGDQFGYALATDRSGQRFYAGAPFTDAGGTDRGAIYAFPIASGVAGTPTRLDGSNALLASGIANGAQLGYALASPIAGSTYVPSVLAGAPGQAAVWSLGFGGTGWDAASKGTTASPPSLFGQGLAVPGRAPLYTTTALAVGSPGASTVQMGEVSGNALPVEVVAFAAQAAGPTVRLAWATASETNNAGFRVEARRVRDSGAWETLGTVGGAGTTTERRDYAFAVPARLSPGRYAFRLTQLDTDGAQHTAGEVEAVVGFDGPALLAVGPNPATGPVNVRAAVRDAQPVRVAVYDLLGRTVALLHDGPMESAEAEAWTLAAGQLAAGRYLVRLEGRAGMARTLPLVVR